MGRPRKHGDEINSEIKRLYVDNSMSLNKISEVLSVHPEVIKRRLKLMGVPIRQLGPAMSNFYKNNRGGT